MRFKLILLFVGAPLALAADRLGQRWLFYVGLALLIVGLLLPVRAGQTLGERFRNLSGHLPLLGWLRPRESPSDENGSRR